MLSPIAQYGPATTYINNATMRNKTFADGDALTGVTMSDGDRIVVAIGHSNGPVLEPEPPPFQAACKFGTSGTDLPENETQTTDGVGWIEFSATFLFDETVFAASTATGIYAPAMPYRVVQVVPSGMGRGPVRE